MTPASFAADRAERPRPDRPEVHLSGADRDLTDEVAETTRELRESGHRVVAQVKPRLRGWIHALTLPLSLVAGSLLIAIGGTLAERIATAVFVITAGMLFGISAIYHRGTWSARRSLMLRRFDHANIFLIIAGTYTPLAVGLLPPRDATVLLIIAWVGALAGVGFRLLWLGAPRWLYVPAYVALGWVAVFYMPQFYAGGGGAVVALIVAGGVLYTLGALVYGLRWPGRAASTFGFHELFHSFTVAAFACHFSAVALAVTA